MAPLSFQGITAREEISERSTPAPLRQALQALFRSIGDGVWLVGGTALAGYYAEHRRSDDLDLFAADTISHRTAVLAVKALDQIGVIRKNERTAPTYYRAEALFQNHPFTIDVVLDENIHRIGRAWRSRDGVWVADLPTLFAMKAACLVSRCSEKDLFDLDWMLPQSFTIKDLLEAGVQIDGGVCIETLLISLQGAKLRQEACHFLLPSSELSVEQAYRKIVSLHKKVIRLLREEEQKTAPNEEVTTLAQAVKDQKDLK